jgi:ribosome-binding factor A
VRSKGHEHRKQAQLCAQVARLASLALGASRDTRLNQLLVHSVDASHDGARLTINVIPTDVANLDALESLTEALEAARPWLRGQVAADINRKRTLEIRFQVLLDTLSDSTAPD